MHRYIASKLETSTAPLFCVNSVPVVAPASVTVKDLVKPEKVVVEFQPVHILGIQLCDGVGLG